MSKNNRGTGKWVDQFLNLGPSEANTPHSVFVPEFRSRPKVIHAHATTGTGRSTRLFGLACGKNNVQGDDLYKAFDTTRFYSESALDVNCSKCWDQLTITADGEIVPVGS